ncbi:helix-turn-helix domain-containing protein [Aeromonas caviae]|uniref:Winged helix-turn-helix domain-containing protein n=1 Tax=Aeromonas caviae TaxID=648 RepID=A0AA37G5S8_AERCA|nr:helix-turn-helix domain-containing protein [Aeromonas caviae]GJA39665.1 hypothetical protein KAM343_04610 [Aeromonas caviae]GJA44417.1 hypothetical protein KAM346_07060 [Aeromonas caviae]GJA98247.1 hypothetical protein KAM359_16550 [Aeromonas caviae]GJB41569.1 hypothetical protein KAM369_20440 [Aeromonas caviae]GJB45775.1 hypothetical protein KAM370_17170 [Aeromonas caviae]
MIELTPPRPEGISQEFYDACVSVKSKRPRTVINHILMHGSITTEELNETYGYDHPPRAIRDVRENGIPLETFKVESGKTGRKIAAYRFDTSQVIAGRIGGRKAFPKQFKDELIAYYGSCSMLTGEKLEPRYLQIDHRIPYEIAGNEADETVDNYMLLDASAQRAKSWSCERCENFTTRKDIAICTDCFWAYPESYNHIAMIGERRIYISWLDKEVDDFERIKKEAGRSQLSVQDFIKHCLGKIV